ncbi:hypothetical protein [Bacillus sp. FJAT-45350]|uniref:hypothetical protein n=1 Tax=Bacillus sp. FJAT-45350 TaxID=2011014 RepID=UPI000BB739BA|nr:hypothetical protein [Bacillus sp. FJAT-45350]
MNLYKVLKKSLTSLEDIEFNHKFGLPIEVFCPKDRRTVAFGRIENLNVKGVQINGEIFNIEENAFFGHRSISA